MFLLAADQVMVQPQEQLEQRVPEVFCVLFMLVAENKHQPVGFTVCFFLSPQLEIYISEGTHSTEEDSECFYERLNKQDILLTSADHFLSYGDQLCSIS